MSSGFELDDDSISGLCEDDDLDLEQLCCVESRLDYTAALQSDVVLLDDISIPILKNLSPMNSSPRVILPCSQQSTKPFSRCVKAATRMPLC